MGPTEPSPHNSTDDDEEMETVDTANESNNPPERVLSEESKPVSVISPPRKIQRSVDSDGEKQHSSTGLLCGCI